MNTAWLTCSSSRGPPQCWGQHTGSERCCRSWPVQMSPSSQLNEKQSSKVKRQAVELETWLWWFVSVCVMFTRPLVESVSQKEEDHSESNERSPPSQQKHDHHTAHGAQQRQPLTVEPEGWAPTCGHTCVYVGERHTQLCAFICFTCSSIHSCICHWASCLVSWWWRRGSSWSWWGSRSIRRSWRWWERWCWAQLAERHKEKDARFTFMK